MEKEEFYTHKETGVPHAWDSIFGMESHAGELNSCAQEQPPNCFLNPNWSSVIDRNDPFESALTSIVSSPANSHPGIPIPANESIVLRELIGRLGSICNSGEISPQSYINGNNSTSNSCYNTPLNSPPKLNLSITSHQRFPGQSFPTDLERAARFSGFGVLRESGSGQCFKTVGSQSMGIPDEKDRIPAPEKKSGRFSMSAAPENAELGEESSVSEQIPGGETSMRVLSPDSNVKKRKAIPKGRGKDTQFSAISAKDDKGVPEAEKEESDAKRSKSNEEAKAMEKELELAEGKGKGNQKQTKENAKPSEPPKDYIHVRARRGQATDSHSLAERVRREKISERMKFLQDLVPGCNKVTGKAVMLDEIINYVQSLQRQVEFLSMKLATVNPRMDVPMEALLSRDMFRSQASAPSNMNTLDTLAQPFFNGFQSQLNGIVSDGPENHYPLMVAMHRNSNVKQTHIDDFGEASMFWESDLQSVVQMGLGQNQPQGFHGTMGTGQMKVEL